HSSTGSGPVVTHRGWIRTGSCYGTVPAASTPSLVTPTVVVLVNNATPGYYNNELGTVLDGSKPQFPSANGVCGDPVIKPASEPDLSPASSILGGWLSGNPIPLNANWRNLQAIPATWPVNTETAIVYAIEGGPGGIRNVPDGDAVTLSIT